MGESFGLGLWTEVCETHVLVLVSCEILNHGGFWPWSHFLWNIIISLGLDMILKSVQVSLNLVDSVSVLFMRLQKF